MDVKQILGKLDSLYMKIKSSPVISKHIGDENTMDTMNFRVNNNEDTNIVVNPENRERDLYPVDIDNNGNEPSNIGYIFNTKSTIVDTNLHLGIEIDNKNHNMNISIFDSDKFSATPIYSIVLNNSVNYKNLVITQDYIILYNNFTSSKDMNISYCKLSHTLEKVSEETKKFKSIIEFINSMGMSSDKIIGPNVSRVITIGNKSIIEYNKEMKHVHISTHNGSFMMISHIDSRLKQFDMRSRKRFSFNSNGTYGEDVHKNELIGFEGDTIKNNTIVSNIENPLFKEFISKSRYKNYISILFKDRKNNRYISTYRVNSNNKIQNICTIEVDKSVKDFLYNDISGYICISDECIFLYKPNLIGTYTKANNNILDPVINDKFNPVSITKTNEKCLFILSTPSTVYILGIYDNHINVVQKVSNKNIYGIKKSFLVPYLGGLLVISDTISILDIDTSESIQIKNPYDDELFYNNINDTDKVIVKMLASDAVIARYLVYIEKTDNVMCFILDIGLHEPDYKGFIVKNLRNISDIINENKGNLTLSDVFIVNDNTYGFVLSNKNRYSDNTIIVNNFYYDEYFSYISILSNIEYQSIDYFSEKNLIFTIGSINNLIKPRYDTYIKNRNVSLYYTISGFMNGMLYEIDTKENSISIHKENPSDPNQLYIEKQVLTNSTFDSFIEGTEQVIELDNRSYLIIPINNSDLVILEVQNKSVNLLPVIKLSKYKELSKYSHRFIKCNKIKSESNIDLIDIELIGINKDNEIEQNNFIFNTITHDIGLLYKKPKFQIGVDIDVSKPNQYISKYNLLESNSSWFKYNYIETSVVKNSNGYYLNLTKFNLDTYPLANSDMDKLNKFNISAITDISYGKYLNSFKIDCDFVTPLGTNFIVIIKNNKLELRSIDYGTMYNREADLIRLTQFGKLRDNPVIIDLDSKDLKGIKNSIFPILKSIDINIKNINNYSIHNIDNEFYLSFNNKYVFIIDINNGNISKFIKNGTVFKYIKGGLYCEALKGLYKLYQTNNIYNYDLKLTDSFNFVNYDRNILRLKDKFTKQLEGIKVYNNEKNDYTINSELPDTFNNINKYKNKLMLFSPSNRSFMMFNISNSKISLDTSLTSSFLDGYVYMKAIKGCLLFSNNTSNYLKFVELDNNKITNLESLTQLERASHFVSNVAGSVIVGRSKVDMTQLLIYNSKFSLLSTRTFKFNIDYILPYDDNRFIISTKSNKNKSTIHIIDINSNIIDTLQTNDTMIKSIPIYNGVIIYGEKSIYMIRDYITVLGREYSLYSIMDDFKVNSQYSKIVDVALVSNSEIAVSIMPNSVIYCKLPQY